VQQKFDFLRLQAIVALMCNILVKVTAKGHVGGIVVMKIGWTITASGL